jgi:hypothetical protein
MQPPLVRTLFSGEGEPAADAAARAMAARLAAGGMRTRVVPSAVRATATFFNAGLPVLAGWQLSRWGARVVDGAALRRTVASAIHEALTVVGEARGAAAMLLRAAPVGLLAALLATVRLFLTRRLLAMWQSHGPKIEGQTRTMLDELLARARRDGVAVPHLAELHRMLASSATAQLAERAPRPRP